MNGEIHEQTINIYNNLCIVFEETCQYDKALDIYLRCTNNINEKYGEKHAENFKLLYKLGKLMILKNEFEKAEIYLKESFRLVNNSGVREPGSPLSPFGPGGPGGPGGISKARA